jgi:hypothetical protein
LRFHLSLHLSRALRDIHERFVGYVRREDVCPLASGAKFLRSLKITH